MKLSEYLETYGLKHVTFAKKVGITPANLSNIVNGKSMPCLETALKIEIATDRIVTCEDLAGFDSTKKSKKKQK